MSFRTIPPHDLAEILARETVEVLDVRTPAEFHEIHLVIARNIPLDRLDPKSLRESRNGSADQPLYVICRSGSRGHKACEKLFRAGITNVINIEGGTLACAEIGIPVIRGRKAISLERQVRIAAGMLILLGISLGFLAHEVLFGLSAFVGAGLVFAGVTDFCGMGLLLARMPWNQVKGGCCKSHTEACS